jgi:hypothetical protein
MNLYLERLELDGYRPMEYLVWMGFLNPAMPFIRVVLGSEDRGGPPLFLWLALSVGATDPDARFGLPDDPLRDALLPSRCQPGPQG